MDGSTFFGSGTLAATVVDTRSSALSSSALRRLAKLLLICLSVRQALRRDSWRRIALAVLLGKNELFLQLSEEVVTFGGAGSGSGGATPASAMSGRLPGATAVASVELAGSGAFADASLSGEAAGGGAAADVFGSGKNR